MRHWWILIGVLILIGSTGGKLPLFGVDIGMDWLVLLYSGLILVAVVSALGAQAVALRLALTYSTSANQPVTKPQPGVGQAKA